MGQSQWLCFSPGLQVLTLSSCSGFPWLWVEINSQVALGHVLLEQQQQKSNLECSGHLSAKWLLYAFKWRRCLSKLSLHFLYILSSLKRRKPQCGLAHFTVSQSWRRNFSCIGVCLQMGPCCPNFCFCPDPFSPAQAACPVVYEHNYQ